MSRVKVWGKFYVEMFWAQKIKQPPEKIEQVKKEAETEFTSDISNKQHHKGH